MIGYWNGDEWRWRMRSNGPTTISVIEPSSEDQDETAEGSGTKVPFGFARALPVTEREPLLWEGKN